LSSPRIPNGAVGCKEFRVYPTECRQRYSTYKGDLYACLTWWINGSQQPTVEKCLGSIPIMVKVSTGIHFKVIVRMNLSSNFVYFKISVKTM
jgi:DNA-directed RNA polymerase beta subunit